MEVAWELRLDGTGNLSGRLGFHSGELILKSLQKVHICRRVLEIQLLETLRESVELVDEILLRHFADLEPNSF